MNKIQQILNSFVKKNLNIISFMSSFDLVDSISESGHNFFLINNTAQDLNIAQKRNKKENIHFITHLNTSNDWDLCLVSCRDSQEVPHAHNIKQIVGIPILLFEANTIRHYFPHIPVDQNIPQRLIDKIQNLSPDIEVFKSQEIKNTWPIRESSYCIQDGQNNIEFWNSIFNTLRKNQNEA